MTSANKKSVEETCPRCRGWVWHRIEPCNCKGPEFPRDEPNLLEAIGNRVRATRELHHLSMEELAARAGLSKTGLWQIEKGKSEPMARTLISLAEVLGVTTDFLLLRVHS